MRRRKRAKAEQGELKKEDCYEDFRERVRQALGIRDELPDDCVTTATVIRETGRDVLWGG